MSARPVGVVLAGGRSTRLGTDKAHLEYSGSDLLVRAVRLLESVVGEAWVLGRDAASHGLDNPWLLDETPGLGPAGGIATALAAIKKPVLVTSCDLPLLDAATLEALVAARNVRPEGALLTTYHQVETGFIEALVAVYEPGALGVLRPALDAGARKLSAIFAPHLRHHLPYSRDDAEVFFNINYPSDLALLRKLESAS